MPRLRIDTGKQAGKSYDIARAAIIGRAETAQVQISDTHASREHCKVFEQAGAWVVADLNSRNGIKVNGVQTTRRNLANGDRIVIGETTIVFETTPAPAGAKSPAPPAGTKAPAPSAGTKAPAPPAGSKPAAASSAPSKRDEAFAAARAAASGAAATQAKRPAATAEPGGVKVSDHVLQFNRVDTTNATVLDVDLTQSAGMSRFLIWIACIAFLGLVLWLVVKVLG
jgi:predicted component of type VI protein secretion system